MQCQANDEPAPCDVTACPDMYQDPPTHYGPGGSALWPSNLRAWQIHQSLKLLGAATWQFYPVPTDPHEANVLHLKLMLLAAEDHPPVKQGSTYGRRTAL